MSRLAHCLPLLALLIAGAPAASAADEATPTAQPGDQTDLFSLKAPPVYQVGPGDVLNVRVFGQEEFKDSYLVDDEGMLDLPWVGDLNVNGMSVAQVRRELSRVLAEGYLRAPQVTIQVEEYLSQPVQVLGAVKKADTYYLQGPTRLLDILAMAGGVESKRSSSEIHITRSRDDRSDTKVVQLEELMNSTQGNLLLQPGDVVNVLEGKVFYVGGEVGKPGEVAWKGGITVTRALALAGGAKPTANLRRATIIRADGTTTRVNIRRIMKGKDDDAVLNNGDQLFVGESAF